MMTRPSALVLLLLFSFVTVDSFVIPTLYRKHVVLTNGSHQLNSSPDSDAASFFQYTPTSLQHIQNVDLPPDYSRPWTTEKTIAAVGALIVGGLLGYGAEFVGHDILGVEDGVFLLLFGAIGAGGGWYLFGGRDIAESEMPINGGYDAKLIADRPLRLKKTLEYLEKQPNVVIQTSCIRNEESILPYISMVHQDAYLQELKQKSLETDRPKRLNPLYARTLIDEHSYTAAVQAVGDWMDSVDAALASNPTFCLCRPPSHHACRGKGKGGCLLNSIAIAAMYALDQPKIKNVAILDVDAHHGNGIAHCVEAESRIRYCSIHENVKEQQSIFVDTEKSPDDPRSASNDDHGPLGNILNINLPLRTGWDSGYAQALETKALPFLCENNPDLLLVAAGFDALDEDWSSSLQLHTDDFGKLGALLKDKFGNRVAFGLEGGYAYENGKLAYAIYEFVKPWKHK